MALESSDHCNILLYRSLYFVARHSGCADIGNVTHDSIPLRLDGASSLGGVSDLGINEMLLPGSGFNTDCRKQRSLQD